MLNSAQIGSGFSARTDPAALVIGPTGVGLGPDGTLYVADTLNNRIAAIPGPLGLAIAPDGHILTVNSGDGNMVETMPDGTQVATVTVDNNQGGAGNLFGLAVKPGADAVYFVDDFGGGPNNNPPAQNNLQILF